MNKHQGKRVEIEELPQEQTEELTPQEAETARGGLGTLPRLTVPGGPPISPTVTLMGPEGPPI